MIKTVKVTHRTEQRAMAFMSAMTYLGYDAVQVLKVDDDWKTFGTIDMFGEPDDNAGARLVDTVERILDGEKFPDKPEVPCLDCGFMYYRAAMVVANDGMVCRDCYGERGKPKAKDDDFDGLRIERRVTTSLCKQCGVRFPVASPGHVPVNCGACTGMNANTVTAPKPPTKDVGFGRSVDIEMGGIRIRDGAHSVWMSFIGANVQPSLIDVAEKVRGYQEKIGQLERKANAWVVEAHKAREDRDSAERDTKAYKAGVAVTGETLARTIRGRDELKKNYAALDKRYYALRGSLLNILGWSLSGGKDDHIVDEVRLIREKRVELETKLTEANERASQTRTERDTFEEKLDDFKVGVAKALDVYGVEPWDVDYLVNAVKSQHDWIELKRRSEAGTQMMIGQLERELDEMVVIAAKTQDEVDRLKYDLKFNDVYRQYQNRIAKALGVYGVLEWGPDSLVHRVEDLRARADRRMSVIDEAHKVLGSKGFHGTPTLVDEVKRVMARPAPLPWEVWCMNALRPLGRYESRVAAEIALKRMPLAPTECDVVRKTGGGE
ncbi:MAG: hypothetical protein JRL30_00880 [Deltaproteobacteria bacterium]|nr:hypothetical protein [Deltaproteobacteria bacterium]